MTKPVSKKSMKLFSFAIDKDDRVVFSGNITIQEATVILVNIMANIPTEPRISDKPDNSDKGEKL